jgi:IS6 family transposase
MEGGLWRFLNLQQRRYLNNTVEEDCQQIKRLVRPGIDFGGLEIAQWTLVETR